MMKYFKIITLFPVAFNDFINTSIIKRAIAKQEIAITILDIRNFAHNKHHQVDDYPYGGGAGMVLQALPVIEAIEAAKLGLNKPKVILLTPQGKIWNQQLAYEYSKADHDYILVCGHYEGIDERITLFIDEEISIGDYVLTGGEVPTMVLIDSISRLLANVITTDSHLKESFNDNLLDYPSYTRPEIVRDLKVPAVLLSGHHENIKNYRHQQALLNTYKKRPDLLVNYHLTKADKEFLAAFEKQQNQKGDT